MSTNIEIDNQEKLMKFKSKQPHPSYISGFIDGDGCIFIRKIKDGYWVVIITFTNNITYTKLETNLIRYYMKLDKIEVIILILVKTLQT